MNIKCNICGGDVLLSADKTFATCEYCGSTITVPKVSDEQRAAAFNRGNHFRRIGEFDKALASYERILRDDDTDAEAHWCAALCRFGIEYVEDPATYEWLPTCHRASFDSFTEDVDYKAALEYSDGLTRRLYQKEAAKIAEVQKGILATSQNEEPYDVFLCYKETGEDGQRTKDSILAQDIYYQLTDQGHRVFFSRITLEDKAGSQYEPYIFAALNSAKVMVAVGTKPEHFSAVWVKNEWSRFLALMRRDRSRVLLPCYRDMDPYDLPEQLAVLQSYDMGKIGFIQDLIHGVDKVVKAGKAAPAPVVQQVQETVQTVGSNVEALMERGFMELEDQEWQKADQFFEEALNHNAKLAEAYLGKFLAEQNAMDLNTLVHTYLHKSENVQSVRKDACEKNLLAESDAVNKYTIPAYLNEEHIRNAFNIGRSFESIVDPIREQWEKAQHLIHADKNLSRAIKFGNTELQQQITAALDQIIPVMQERLEQAVALDNRKQAAAREHYENAVRLATKRIADEYQKLTGELEPQYQEACKSNPWTTPTWMLEHPVQLFTNLGTYKDSAERLAQLNLILDRRNRECCQHCGGEFFGFFAQTCYRCRKPRDY